MITIYRDGVEVAKVNTEFEVLAWFHERHSFSVEHAIQHEGYTVVDDDELIAEAYGL